MTDQSGLIPQIITPRDHSLLGAQMTAAGMDQGQISDFLGKLQAVARDNANIAAQNTALSMTSLLVDMIGQVRRATAMNIYRRIQAQGAGFGGLVTHRTCTNIALEVAGENPRYLGNMPRTIEVPTSINT